MARGGHPRDSPGIQRGPGGRASQDLSLLPVPSWRLGARRLGGRTSRRVAAPRSEKIVFYPRPSLRDPSASAIAFGDPRSSRRVAALRPLALARARVGACACVRVRARARACACVRVWARVGACGRVRVGACVRVRACGPRGHYGPRGPLRATGATGATGAATGPLRGRYGPRGPLRGRTTQTGPHARRVGRFVCGRVVAMPCPTMCCARWPVQRRGRLLAPAWPVRPLPPAQRACPPRQRP